MQTILRNELSGMTGIPGGYSNGYAGSRPSPAAIGAAIAIHVCAAVAILMMPSVKIGKEKTSTILGYPVEEPVAPPPPAPEAKIRTERAAPSPDPLPEPLPVLHGQIVIPFSDANTILTQPGTGLAFDIVAPSAGLAPVLVAARPDPRFLSDFQPGYPPSMIRAQIEGQVTVRVHITARGRVEEIDLVSASDPASWDATRRQALHHWRFRPATRDGVPVASVREMTVQFTLTDLR